MGQRLYREHQLHLAIVPFHTKCSEHTKVYQQTELYAMWEFQQYEPTRWHIVTYQGDLRQAPNQQWLYKLYMFFNVKMTLGRDVRM